MGKVMEYKGYKAQIMEAPRLTGDQVHGLPPGTPLEVYPVDAFKKAPENWMKGAGVFVVPVKPDKGLWFDWRGNSETNTAVIPTVKGCNPITGLQTTGFHLERYETKCPKHNCDFLAERFCPECNYKWPDRNYQSMSPSWWDGFRADDGYVRQFFFSEDELRDVASGLIGKENTTPAFGFAFYAPKVRRPEAPIMRGGFNFIYPTNYSGNVGVGTSAPMAKLHINYGLQNSSGSSSEGYFGNNLMTTHMKTDGPEAPLHAVYLCSSCSAGIGSATPTAGPCGALEERSANIPVKEVSIGAGAKISQALNADTFSIDEWKDAPDAVMTIYFVFQEKFNEIAAGGLRDLEGAKEGFLSNIVVG